MVGEQLIVGITETQAKTIRKARWWIGDCWRIVFGHHLSLGRTSPSAMSRRKSPRVVAKIICGGAVRQMTMTASRKVRARPMSRTATRFPTGSGRPGASVKGADQTPDQMGLAQIQIRSFSW